MNKLYFMRVVEKTQGLFTSSPRQGRDRQTDRQRCRERDREGRRDRTLQSSLNLEKEEKAFSSKPAGG